MGASRDTEPVATVRCPCLSGEVYDECCGRLHRGEASAPTAEALMRSRYSAFEVGDEDYIRRTWHSSTRPAAVTLEPGVRWYRLDILATTRGGLLDATGTVEFRAFYRAAAADVATTAAAAGSGAGVQHETSRFVREDGAWAYVDGVG